MKKTTLILAVIVMFAMGGCSGGGAEELFETAQLEELQHNETHAKELYQRIVEKYPDSAYAEKARARLAQMGSLETNR